MGIVPAHTVAEIRRKRVLELPETLELLKFFKEKKKRGRVRGGGGQGGSSGFWIPIIEVQPLVELIKLWVFLLLLSFQSLQLLKFTTLTKTPSTHLAWVHHTKIFFRGTSFLFESGPNGNLFNHGVHPSVDPSIVSSSCRLDF